MKPTPLRVVFFGLCFLQVVPCALAQTKLAFVAGVEKYDRDGFESLQFAEEDAVELKAELEKLGFDTVAVVGKEANRAGLMRGLSRLHEKSKKLRKEDVVLVFLSGHGVQKLVRRNINGQEVESEEPFFCPSDAHKNDLETMLNINEVLDRLKDDSASRNNIVLIDACRESLDKRAKGIDGSTFETLPNKLAVFFAAQSGRRSFEARKLNHGIFTHYLIQGLRGEAADKDGEVTLQGLTNYVSKRVQRDSPSIMGFDDESDAQEPNLIGNLRGTLVLGKVSDPVAQTKGLSPTPLLADKEPENPKTYSATNKNSTHRIQSNIDYSSIYQNRKTLDAVEHRVGIGVGTQVEVIEHDLESRRVLVEWKDSAGELRRGWILESLIN